MVSTKSFLAGLLDWVGDGLPTSDAIAGASLLRQGMAHVLTIRENGGQILGIRPLDLDDIEPYEWLTQSYWPGALVYRGTMRKRKAMQVDASLPTMSVWGYKYISGVAERWFVEKVPIPAMGADSTFPIGP